MLPQITRGPRALMAHQETIPQSSNATVLPKRRLGLVSSIAIVVGNMVGVGIFLTPADVAKASPNHLFFFMLWILGALMAAFGAKVYAELGAMFPRAGGDYAFLSEAYGSKLARAWGWLSVFGCFPSSIATLAVGVTVTLADTSGGGVISTNLLTVGGFSLTVADIVGLALIWLSTGVNIAGLSISGKTQLLITAVPFVLFLIGGLTAVSIWDVHSVADHHYSKLDPDALATAFCAVFFTFSGWNVITYLGGEVIEPQRNIPRVIFISMSVSTLLFLLLNWAFVAVIPLGQLAGTQNAGVAVATRLLGESGRDAFALLLAMAIIGGLNATVMAGARIAMAMAHGRFLWERMGTLCGRRHTPRHALLFQAVIASMFVLTGSFTFLITATGGIMILLSCITVSTIFVFRWRRLKRQLFTFGNVPWAASFFLLTGAGMALMIAINDFWIFSIGSFVFIALSACDYYVPQLKRMSLILAVAFTTRNSKGKM